MKDSNWTFQWKYNEKNDEYFICWADEYECTSYNDIFQITYDKRYDTSYICWGDEYECSSSNDIFQIKWVYICPWNVSCSQSNSLYVPYFLIPLESILSIIIALL